LETREAIEGTDARIGRVLATVDEIGATERTAVAIVSDHGFLPVSRSLAPNSVLRDAGLVTVDAGGGVKSWRAFFHANGGSAGLVLNDPTEAGLVAQVRTLFEPRLRDPQSGLAAILDAERIAQVGGTARWSLVLDAQEGFDFSPAATGEWSIPSKSLGNHGYAPDRPDLYASLVIVGPGLSRKGDLGVVRMTSIGPTIAAYLGLRLGPSADSPLEIW
jgi:predicted AlkP superfamily pyrophosphatase or phosphodiesterase